MAFDASQLYKVQQRLDEMFSGARFSAHLNKPVPTLIAALTRQTARFNPVLQGRELRGVEVSFLTSSSNVKDGTIDPVNSCEIGGDRAASAKITIVPTEDLYDEFTVVDDQVDGLFDMEKEMAEQMARKMSEIRLVWNNKILAFFNANTMLPDVHADDGTLVGNVITVAKATLSSADYIAKVQLIAEMNDVYDAFIISGRMFWVEKYKAMFKTAACCSVDALFDGPFDISFDLRNIDSVVGTDAVLLIDPGSYAIFPTNDFDNDTPIERAKDTVSFRLKDPILQYSNGGTMVSVYYDVLVQDKCVIDDTVSPARERWGKSVRLHMRWGKTLAPDPGGFGTGIIEFNGV